MRKTEIKITIESDTGEKVTPDNVPASEVARYILHLEAAVASVARANGHEVSERAFFNFSRTEEGSCAIVQRLDDDIFQGGYKLLERAILSRKPEAIPSSAYEEMLKFEDLALKAGRKIMFRGSLAMSGANRLPPLPPPRTISGRTVVYGVIQRVNGGKSDAAARLDNGNTVRLTGLSDDLLRKAGGMIKRRVRIDGKALWNRETMAIVEIAPDDVSLQEDNFFAVIDELRRAIDGSMDGIDPVKYVRKLRGNS